MTVENLFTDVLNSLVAAQYESYVFSQSLGEQDTRLLPIPTAEIKEITLDVNYAYERKDDAGFNEAYDAQMIFTKLSGLIERTLTRYQKRIVDEVDASDESDNLKWIEVKKNLLSGKLLDFMQKDIRKPLTSGIDDLLNKSQIEGVQYSETLVNLLAPLLQGTVERNVLKHPDMKAFVKSINIQDMNEKVKNSLTHHHQEIATAISSSVKHNPKYHNIIVDSAILRELPPQAIQNAKVVMKMRNIIVEK